MKQLLVSHCSTEICQQTAHLLQVAGQGDLLLLGTNETTVALPKGLGQVFALQAADNLAAAPMEYAAAIAQWVQQENYDTVAFYEGKLSHAAACLTAQKLNVPCYTEVLSVENIQHTLRRRVYASNLQAEFSAQGCKVITVARGKPAQKPEITNYVVQPVEGKPKKADWVIDTQLEPRLCKNPLEDAKLLFVAGKGIGSAKNYARLERLAHRLGGAVGATRAVVLSGWAPLDAMIGQSGTIAAPEVCVTFGASGAAPFLVGVEQAQKLIAINHDSSASIFQAAQQGITVDCVQVLDAMEQQLT